MTSPWCGLVGLNPLTRQGLTTGHIPFSRSEPLAWFSAVPFAEYENAGSRGWEGEDGTVPSEHAPTTEITLRAHAAVLSDIPAAFPEESRFCACSWARIGPLEALVATSHPRAALRSCCAAGATAMARAPHRVGG